MLEGEPPGSARASLSCLLHASASTWLELRTKFGGVVEAKIPGPFTHHPPLRTALHPQGAAPPAGAQQCPLAQHLLKLKYADISAVHEHKDTNNLNCCHSGFVFVVFDVQIQMAASR